jgi:hypothetical protein
VTNESATGTQQIARAADDLNRLTVNLQNLITKFKLTGGASAQQSAGHAGVKGADTSLKAKKQTQPQARIAVRENGALVHHNGG